MDQKQDLILQYLQPKRPIGDASSTVDSVSNYDVNKAPFAASGDEKLEHKPKSSSKKSVETSSDDDDDDIDDDKEDDDDEDF